MSLVGYDRPPLQAPSIYIPYKDAVTCRNRAWTGPLPIAAGRFWHDSDTLRHLYTGCRRCRAKKCHIWWWSTQGWCLLIFGSRVQTHMHVCLEAHASQKLSMTFGGALGTSQIRLLFTYVWFKITILNTSVVMPYVAHAKHTDELCLAAIFNRAAFRTDRLMP